MQELEGLQPSKIQASCYSADVNLGRPLTRSTGTDTWYPRSMPSRGKEVGKTRGKEYRLRLVDASGTWSLFPMQAPAGPR